MLTIYILSFCSPHYRPKSPPPSDTSPPISSCSGPRTSTSDGRVFGRQTSEFDIESFHSHQEQLLEMQREQQQRLFTEDDHDTAAVLDLEPMLHQGDVGSHFTLDSASAEFAVRALVESPDLGAMSASEGTTSGSVSTVVASPIGSRTNLQQLSFSLVNKTGDSASAVGSNGKTGASSLSSMKLSQSDSSVVAKLPIIASSVLTSSLSSVSLLHKSSSAPMLPQIALSSQQAVSSASPSVLPTSTSLLPSVPFSSTATILLSKTNGPLSSSTHGKYQKRLFSLFQFKIKNLLLRFTICKDKAAFPGYL